MQVLKSTQGASVAERCIIQQDWPVQMHLAWSRPIPGQTNCLEMRVFCAPTPAGYCCDLIVFFKHELRENARSGKLDTILLFVGGL